MESSKIAVNSMYLFIRMIIVYGVTLYTSRVVLRMLGFEDYGIYNVVGSIIIFFGFLRTALTNATFRFITYELGTNNIVSLRKVYSMAINSHLLLATIIFVVLEIVGSWFLNNRLNIDDSRLYAANWVFQFTLVSFFISIVQTPFHSVIIAYEKMSFYAVLSLLEVILRLAIVYLLLIIPIDKLIIYGALMLAVTLIVFLCHVIYCKLSFRELAYVRIWNTQMLKQFSSYSGWSLLVNTADICTQQSISIFFNIFLGVISNAALGIANQVSSATNTFLQNFVQACNPQIVKSYASKNYDYFLKLVYSSSKISFLLLLFVAVPIITNTKFILDIWLGDYPEYTIVFVRLMILYYLIDAFQTSLWQAMHATGKIKIHQIMIGSLKFLNIPLIYICLYYTKSGPWGLGIWVLVNLLCAVVRTIYMRTLIDLDVWYYLKNVVLRIFVVFTIVLLASLEAARILGSNWEGFVASLLVSTLFIILLSYGFCFNKQEKELVKSIAKKIIRK